MMTGQQKVSGGGEGARGPRHLSSKVAWHVAELDERAVQLEERPLRHGGEGDGGMAVMACNGGENKRTWQSASRRAAVAEHPWLSASRSYRWLICQLEHLP
ncbi:Os04g0471901 [Oryza sativa Japonica Group]|uniref:Os04g0471901 protein n=1 Tax=Oryza sativa subsp. japonica TaxID=39947 RepID=A0A0P0WB78_ORYSJ|nr:Os04g0471901 [Oryza sativa Japonica Group]